MANQCLNKTKDNSLPFILMVHEDSKNPDFYMTKIIHEFPDAFSAYSEKTILMPIPVKTVVYKPSLDDVPKEGKCYSMNFNLIVSQEDFDCVKKIDVGRNNVRITYGFFRDVAEVALKSLFETQVVAFAYRVAAIERKIREEEAKDSL